MFIFVLQKYLLVVFTTALHWRLVSLVPHLSTTLKVTCRHRCRHHHPHHYPLFTASARCVLQHFCSNNMRAQRSFCSKTCDLLHGYARVCVCDGYAEMLVNKIFAWKRFFGSKALRKAHKISQKCRKY